MLLGVFDRSLDEGGAEVLWSIVLGLESLPSYEPALLESAELRPTSFKRIMVDRLLRADSASPRTAAGRTSAALFVTSVSHSAGRAAELGWSAAKGQNMASPSDPAGTGEAAVEQSPLRTTFVRSHSRFVLSWPDDGALEIKYHRMVRVVAWVLCILGWPVLLLGLLGLIGQLMKPEAAEHRRPWDCCCSGAARFGLMGVWLLGPRYRFDASDGWMTVRHFWRTRRRPLEQIRAVQMIDAGWFGTKYDEGLDGDSPVKFLSYQLNLVLDDPNEPRVFVTYNSDFTDMARKAKILADFLGVPLLAAPRVHELVQTYQRARCAGAARCFGGSALSRQRRLAERARPAPAGAVQVVDRRGPAPAGAGPPAPPIRGRHS